MQAESILFKNAQNPLSQKKESICLHSFEIETNDISILFTNKKGFRNVQDEIIQSESLFNNIIEKKKASLFVFQNNETTQIISTQKLQNEKQLNCENNDNLKLKEEGIITQMSTNISLSKSLMIQEENGRLFEIPTRKTFFLSKLD